MIALVVASWRVIVVNPVHEHARLARRRQIHRHRGSECIDLLGDQGVNVRVDRIDPRRHEDARPIGAHLMHVVDDLGAPPVVHLLHNQPGLLLGEDVPVPVVVVTQVLVIEGGERSSFVGSSDPTPVPLPDLVDPVGIQRGHQEQDRVRENGAVPVAVLRQQVVGELHGRHRRSHFVRMDRASDDDGWLALFRQFESLFLCNRSGVGELGQDLPVALDLLERLGSGKRRKDQRPALGGQA